MLSEWSHARLSMVSGYTTILWQVWLVVDLRRVLGAIMVRGGIRGTTWAWRSRSVPTTQGLDTFMTVSRNLESDPW
ncbi:hypothetical protein C7974DRAFT_387288 [Boeremia exigua]|uniref:uncharacterized protein n=1 Tax=Boeremia exigua TaxID=749465 RepID=UPI001E8DE03B|nr:uncharacterized protein C7974DRAFT_387288 [Boeremia exigua]KAH6638778.1 hypothetical protein C7974DRAFT_387288 [Boeremia exigua]